MPVGKKEDEAFRRTAAWTGTLARSRVEQMCFPSSVSLTVFTPGVQWPVPRSFPWCMSTFCALANERLLFLTSLDHRRDLQILSIFQSRTGDQHCSRRPRCNIRTTVPEMCPHTSKLLLPFGLSALQFSHLSLVFWLLISSRCSPAQTVNPIPCLGELLLPG